MYHSQEILPHQFHGPPSQVPLPHHQFPGPPSQGPLPHHQWHGPPSQGPLPHQQFPGPPSQVPLPPQRFMPPPATNKTLRLQVNIQCCKGCYDKAMRKLPRLQGVNSLSYDEEKRILTVVGREGLDPEVVVKKFKKWGKVAELLSVERDAQTMNNAASRPMNNAAYKEKKVGFFAKIFGCGERE